eukprot:3941763-Rhodomonas_salina.2
MGYAGRCDGDREARGGQGRPRGATPCPYAAVRTNIVYALRRCPYQRSVCHSVPLRRWRYEHSVCDSICPYAIACPDDRKDTLCHYAAARCSY